jgi:hypothetical protein
MKADGTVVAVGWEIHEECDVGPWTGINSITAGGAHTVGLNPHGTVVATGNSVDDQCDVGDWIDIAQISGGWDHTVGLKVDGTVIATGLDDNHQCDVDGWTGIVQVAAGGRHTVGLRSDGTLVAGGWNDEHHQCDVGDWDLDEGGWVLPLAYLNPQRYQVEYIFTVSNQGFNINELRVYAPRPVEWDAQENVLVDEVSPPPSDEGADPTHGNGMYHWHMWGQPLSGQTISFNVRFDFTAYEIITSIDPDDVQPYDDNESLYALYTQAEPFIEATDPQIVELASQVAEGETNPYLLARRFYDYIAVTDTLEYNLLRTDGWGAKALLTTGEGECGDFAALFCALCRAAGIPARPVAGHWAVSGEQAHIWAEFYVEPFGWIPVDPTIGHVDSGWRRDYYFGAMDNQRVIFNKGFSIYLDPPTPGNDMVAHLQGPYWFFWGSGDAEDMQLEWISWTVEEIP